MAGGHFWWFPAIDRRLQLMPAPFAAYALRFAPYVLTDSNCRVGWTITCKIRLHRSMACVIVKAYAAKLCTP